MKNNMAKLTERKGDIFMNILRKYFWIFLVLNFVIFVPAYADPAGKDHGHKTPYGGIVQEAEGMHAEFLIDKSGQPKLYLYDKSMKPLDQADLEAKLMVRIRRLSV